MPGRVGLEGARVALEPFDWDVHGEDLFVAVAGASNDAIWAFMPVGPFADIEPFRQFLAYADEALGWKTLVFRRKRDDRVVGMSSYMRIRPEHGSAEVGCVAFGNALKRTPEASEAMYLMAAHVFDDLGYRRYEWKCHNENKASKRAAERIGFLFEGVFRNDMVVRGNSRDTAWYAMTDEDWPSVKAAFEGWLAPGNFNPDGQQRQSLEAFRA